MRHAPMVFRETADGVLLAPATCGLLTVPDLVAHVRAWRTAGTSETLVVDLSEVEHLDSPAVRALLWSRRFCAAAGREMTMVPPRSGVLAEPEELLLRSLIPVQAGPAVREPAAAPAPLATA